MINDPDPIMTRSVRDYMSDREPDNHIAVSVRVVLERDGESGPVTVCVDARLGEGRVETGTLEEFDNQNSGEDENFEDNSLLPKYACPHCGSDEVRGDFDTIQVYRAEGEKLVHLRSEFTDPAVLALHCLECDSRIEVDDLGEIRIE